MVVESCNTISSTKHFYVGVFHPRSGNNLIYLSTVPSPKIKTFVIWALDGITGRIVVSLQGLISAQTKYNNAQDVPSSLTLRGTGIPTLLDISGHPTSEHSCGYMTMGCEGLARLGTFKQDHHHPFQSLCSNGRPSRKLCLSSDETRQ